jgi:energy-coupling factor transport system substrate-specific component
LTRLPGFSRWDWGIVLAVGIITPLIDSRIEVYLVQFFLNISGSINVFDYTGGPLNRDALVAWEEYGALIAAFIVRKPGAATAAMTINGFGQFIVDGFQGPHHLLYGVAGLGADLVLAAFRYRRFDLRAAALAGISCQLFWIPVTYTYHNVLGRFSTTFVVGDILTRLAVGAVVDGVFGALLGLALLRSLGPKAGMLSSAPPEISGPSLRQESVERHVVS